MFFLRTIWPILSKFGIKHPWVKGLMVLQLRTNQLSKVLGLFFFSPMQLYEIIIALIDCDN